jgi:hypothetical protein
MDEMANAMRFFRLLDELEAEGDAIDAKRVTGRIEKLYAEPTPKDEAVELITIHKAKGLEWDVVIVPALERRVPSSRGKLLDWMEVDSGEEDAAQVVLAPISGKGEESSELHGWIRSVNAAREEAERKRLLYVACTRAREVLHLFAAPERSAKGAVSVAANSLLKSAWPVAEEFFEDGGAKVSVMGEPSAGGYGTFLGDLAAESEGLEESAGKPPMVQRLPLEYDPLARFVQAPSLLPQDGVREALLPTFDRPEGSLAARAFGNAVHAFLEMAAERLAGGLSDFALSAEIPGWRTRISALLRGDGLAPAIVERLARRVVDTLQSALADPNGQWILAPHRNAANEVARTGWQEGPDAIRTGLRLDRIFRAGAAPRQTGEDFLWIVDYKTANHGSEGLDGFIAQERRKYQPQLEAYARTMARMQELQDPPVAGLRVALYYPALARLEWWAPESLLQATQLDFLLLPNA